METKPNPLGANRGRLSGPNNLQQLPLLPFIGPTNPSVLAGECMEYSAKLIMYLMSSFATVNSIRFSVLYAHV